jgi:glutamate synthase (NADPH/NADH) small chain
MSAGRTHPNVIPPQERTKIFGPYVSNLDQRTALYEATRCFMCYDAPCINGCPTRINIPEFIYRIKTGNYFGAAKIIRESNIFGGECGYVCPVERLCEQKCIRNNLKDEPVAIGLLQRFAYENEKPRGLVKFDKASPNGKNVAIIGAGPTGLSVAYELARKGYQTTVFDVNKRPGGLMLYSILPWKADWSVPETEIENIKSYGVKIVPETVKEIKSLLKQFDALYLGVGSSISSPLGTPGENLYGVYLAQDFLSKVAVSLKGEGSAPDLKGKRVAVVGGGDTAIDAACASVRLGAEKVYIVYRRSIAEMPAVGYGRNQAREEGVEFMLLTSITKVNGKRNVESIECQKMELGQKDASGRRSVKPISGSGFTLAVDAVVAALGQKPDGDVLEAFGVSLKDGLIVVNANGETSIRGVFAGGDAVNGGDTVVEAVAEGKKAADSIDKYLLGKEKR